MKPNFPAIASTIKSRKQTVMLIVTQGAGSGHSLTMISSTPDPGGGEMNGALNNIFETVRFAGETDSSDR